MASILALTRKIQPLPLARKRKISILLYLVSHQILQTTELAGTNLLAGIAKVYMCSVCKLASVAALGEQCHVTG